MEKQVICLPFIIYYLSGMKSSSCCNILEEVIDFIIEFFRKLQEGKSIFWSFEKHGYSYESFAETTNRHFVNGKMITEIIMSKSPLEEIPFFRHYEIILQIDSTFFRLSFANDGLTIDVGYDRWKLLGQRKKSKVKQGRSINRKVEDLRQFLIDHQNDKYHVLFWNCKDFAKALWKHLTIAP